VSGRQEDAWRAWLAPTRDAIRITGKDRAIERDLAERLPYWRCNLTRERLQSLGSPPERLRQVTLALDDAEQIACRRRARPGGLLSLPGILSLPGKIVALR
jgi:hypothetical protein